MKEPVKILIVGAGERGRAYANHVAAHPEAAQIVGVAEPRKFQREDMAATHSIPPGHVFADWRDAAGEKRFADAVVIATQDQMHVEPTVAFAEKGYHILLEKPMATTLEGCRTIARAVRESGIMFAVCHVLRYTSYTRKLKAVLDSGRIGDLISIQHLEPVAPWHQAHSFVRGNWRKTSASSPMILAKSCHDMDWMQYVVGARCKRISSFGGLKHFRPENRPQGATDRCLDCPVSPDCPYSAQTFYFKLLKKGRTGWPLSVLINTFTEQELTKALRTGPYGRCVYACDNDVVDHQTVNLEFEGGLSGTFTMTAFAGQGYGRTTRLFGSRGEIYGDSRVIRVMDFLSGETEEIDTKTESTDAGGGHGGGDGGLMAAFLEAVATENPSLLTSGLEETFASHEMAFAAERARLEGSVVDVPTLSLDNN